MGVIRLTGTLTSTPDEVERVRAALCAHVSLTRAEPGCLSFDMTETAPGVFSVVECFADRAAFDAHQQRTRASDWWQVTGHMTRDFDPSEA
ncbi:antibiotic biosynthesis monooxygenase [Roseovarius sp. A-2]|uniref:putative quinol monooxygenase n=1 Tax=Roseovarius sp. A-2 TaxID=1570360 RepID=UPI0009B57143|nr:putative quinol monooxygenase [Roseovarius sp. A-2]GAW33893.1 antibiotic biosynthesis monooxygenase [Roseovarius sp. A-2]